MKVLKIIGKVLAVLGITVAALLILCIVAIFLMEKGPSESAKVLFVRSVNETSRMGFLGRMFLSEDEVNSIMTSSDMVELEEGQTSDTSLIDVDDNASDEPIEIIEVSGSSFNGVLMIVHDPSKVFCGTIEEFGEFQGTNVQGIIDRYTSMGYDIAGGVNGGDFIDNGANSSFTAQPLGAVISEGEVVFSDNGDGPYHLCGFTEDNVFVMGNITLTEAEEMGIRDAIYCVHNTGPFLVMDGEALVNEVPDSATYGGGKNPRTAIGQRADGAILLLVVDGRQASSLGATFKDLAYTMLEYGAVNAAAMDGGTSSQMIYQNEILNHPYAPTGPRKCPTAWLVKN